MSVKRTVPQGFNSAVLQSLGSIKVSSAFITMVRKGKRTNDAVLLAIIITDHFWNKLQYDRIKHIIE